MYVYVCSSRGHWPLVKFLIEDHCIHMPWCISMGVEHSNSWVESHIWQQQSWGQRSSRGCLGIFTFLLKVFWLLYPLYCMGLGHNDTWVKSHMWHLQKWGQESSRGHLPFHFKGFKNDHFIHTIWCISMGVWQSNPWVESYLWTQGMWGHWSYRGHLGSLTYWFRFFWHPSVSTYFEVFVWDLDTMIHG